MLLLGLVLSLFGLSMWAVADAPTATSYSFTILDAPGATYTESYSINASGQVTGSYRDSSGSHGFVYGNGTYTTLTPPGARFTFARSINASGQVTGRYSDGTNFHGFIYSNGTFTTLDVPDAILTVAHSINYSGQVTGSYSDGPDTHGFIATPIVTDIPTLSEWAMLLLLSLLLGISGWWLRQRKPST